MADTDHDPITFDFFGLPRELRNCIYCHALAGTGDVAMHGSASFTLPVHAHNLPLTNLLLINRQFKQEYAEMAEEALELTVEDHLYDVGDYLVPSIPPRLRTARALHFNLVASCPERDHGGHHSITKPPCTTLKTEITVHRERIENWLTCLVQLKTVTIDLHINYHRFSQDCKRTAVAEHQVLAAARCVKTLAVYWTDWVDVDSPDWDYSDREPPVMEWTAKSGVLSDLGFSPKSRKTEAPPDESLEPDSDGLSEAIPDQDDDADGDDMADEESEWDSDKLPTEPARAVTEPVG